MERIMNDVGYLINKAARLTKWELNNRLGDVGLTSPQFAVLREIFCNESKGDDKEYLTPAAIAERIYADRPTISGIIQRLTNQGWVRRIEKPNDRRSKIIVLTDKAIVLMGTLDSLSSETMKKGLKDFSEEEIENLKKYLLKIINNFK
jgi:DNA-binding MarR family transcriptional regulator